METYNDVKEFMDACDHNERGIATKQAALYIELIKEEFNELLDAFIVGDLVGIADGCADLKWVIEGLEHTLNIPQQEIWDEVYNSNMTKIDENGKALRNPETGKVMKVEGVYKAPNIKMKLEEAGLI